MCVYIYIFFFQVFTKFTIYFEGAEGQSERERGNPKQALHCQHRAQYGVRSHKLRGHDLSQNQESDVEPTEPLPGRPCVCIFLNEYRPHTQHLGSKGQARPVCPVSGSIRIS